MGKDTRPYFTLTNEYPRHRKIRGLSDKAFRLHVTLIALCNGDRSDGALTAGDLEMMGPKPAKELLTAGLVVADGDQYRMHDYLEHQKSRAEIESLMADRSRSGGVGGRKSAHTRWHVQRGRFDAGCEFCIDLSREPAE